MLNNGRHHQGSTEMNLRDIDLKSLSNLSTKTIGSRLTFPHDDLGWSAGFEFALSAANSSARPHEQFLQALRLPVVLHTGNRENVDK